MRVSAAARWITITTLLLAWAAPGAAGPRPTCADLVAGRVYRCAVRASFGAAFEDCFRATQPTPGAPRFDLAVDRLRTPFGCACEPRGDVRRPKFAKSARFACAGGGTTGSLAVSLAGRVASDGRRLRAGIGANDAGDTLVFQCVEDPACAVEVEP
jgi:hypothetical protein